MDVMDVIDVIDDRRAAIGQLANNRVISSIALCDITTWTRMMKHYVQCCVREHRGPVQRHTACFAQQCVCGLHSPRQSLYHIRLQP